MAKREPMMISTWEFGLEANRAGWEILSQGGCALDAVEKAAIVTENNPEITSVGYGGYPNERGVVQLDAAVIDGKTGKMGAVAALENVRNPASVARRIMEEGKHIFLVGAGAKEFALRNKFQEENLLTANSASWYAGQLKQRENDSGHDTLGVIALDAFSDLAVVCTTSGLSMKWNGRVGDSPLIGCGLYLDNKVGAAVGTGVGERAIEVCGAFSIVEFMRNGLSPEEACKKLIRRVAERNPQPINFQLAFIALTPSGEFGAACLQKGFMAAVYASGENRLKPPKIYGVDF